MTRIIFPQLSLKETSPELEIPGNERFFCAEWLCLAATRWLVLALKRDSLSGCSAHSSPPRGLLGNRETHLQNKQRVAFTTVLPTALSARYQDSVGGKLLKAKRHFSYKTIPRTLFSSRGKSIKRIKQMQFRDTPSLLKSTRWERQVKRFNL